MAEWTPAKRKELYASLESGDLEAAIALVEPHVDLRQGDFAPQDKKALKSFAAKAKGNRKLHERIAWLLAHKSGTMRKLGTISFGVLDEFPVELIMEEVRDMTFRMKSKRPDLQEGLMGGRPKEYMSIFEGLNKAAWRFSSDEIFLFPLEFDGPAKAMAEEAKKAAYELGGFMHTLDEINRSVAGMEEDEPEADEEKYAGGHESVLRIIGDLAGAQISGLAYRWMEISGESLLRLRGYVGALDYLDQLASRFHGEVEVQIIKRMYSRILRREARSRVRGQTDYDAFRTELTVLDLSVTHKHLCEKIAVIGSSVAAARRLTSLVDASVRVLEVAGGSEAESLPLHLMGFVRNLKLLDRFTRLPRFDIEIVRDDVREEVKIRQGWALYCAIRWREDLAQNLRQFAEIVLANINEPRLLKIVQDKDEFLNRLEAISASPPPIPVSSAPQSILTEAPKFMSASWTTKWEAEACRAIRSLDDLKQLSKEQVDKFPSPLRAGPSSVHFFDYRRQDWEDKPKLLRMMTEKVLDEAEIGRIYELHEQGELNWLKVGTCLPYVVRYNGGFGITESWETEFAERRLEDMRFVVAMIKKLLRKSYPHKMDLCLIWLGELGAALIYNYLCCASAPDPRMDRMIMEALPRERPWTNFAGAVEQTAHILLRLIEFGRHVKPWWAEIIVHATTLLAEAEAGLKGEAFKDSYYDSGGKRFLEHSSFFALNLLREAGNEAPMREFMRRLSQLTFQKPDLYFLRTRGWGRESEHKITLELYHYYLGDAAAPSILLYLDRLGATSAKAVAEWNLSLWNYFPHIVDINPDAANQYLATHAAEQGILIEAYLDHPKVSYGIAARLVRPFDADPSQDEYLNYQVEWAFKHILANPKRIAPSGRTLLDLLKRGLWVNEPKFVKATIDRFERAVEAGAVEPQAAYHALEEILTVSNPGVMNAAIGVMKRLAKKHKGLTLAMPNVVKEFIARDPEKYAKTFKGLQ